MALCPWCDGTQKLNDQVLAGQDGESEDQAPLKTFHPIPVRQPSIFRMGNTIEMATTCQ